MSYCTPADIVKVVPAQLLAQLSADTGDAPDTDALQATCDDISNLMDSYLLGRYTTPVTTPAAVVGALKAHATRLVVASLFQDRLLLETYASIKQEADLATEWLRAIQKGDLSLPGATPVVTPAASSTASWGSYEKVFGPDPTTGITTIL